jgi:UDP-N-acetylmuramoyl-L-alanyl-D-glutamate--2,6-diaminopimelate ligase
MMAALAPRHAWRLGDLVAGFAEPGPAADRQVSALTLDSRTVYPGSLFLACQGRRVHGLAFAEEAARRGATAILAQTTADWPPQALGLLRARAGIPILGVAGLGERAGALADRFYGEPSARLEVFGVTGTNGKTSVSHFLAQALGVELRCGILGTLGVGFPGDLWPCEQTTPDAVTLQATLAELQARGAGALAMEVSSDALDQGRATAVRFSHALLTNLSRGHLDDHGDLNACGAAKRRLFTLPGLRWAVLNLDDPFHAQVLADLAPEVRVAAFGLDPAATLPRRCDLWVRALSVQPRRQGLRIAIASSLGAGELEVGLIGAFNASNLLAVLSVLLSRGLPLERALRELAEVRGVPGRMESFGGDEAPLVVVDHAHTPDALKKALTNLRLHQGRRVITVVGCGGDRDRGKRPLMGAIAERLSDALILTDDNPRGEDGDAIIAEILGGLSRPDKVRVERQRGLAIRLAIALAGTGDAVLVAGKGHETTQDLGELKVHFSDRAQVVEALREWREGHH